MLFNSYSFIFVFIPLTLGAFYLLAKFKLTNAALASLVIASLIFYSCWNIKYLPLLLASILYNYYIGKHIEMASTKSRAKLFLIIGITVDLLLLGYFKYANFLRIQLITA